MWTLFIKTLERPLRLLVTPSGSTDLFASDFVEVSRLPEAHGAVHLRLLADYRAVLGVHEGERSDGADVVEDVEELQRVE